MDTGDWVICNSCMGLNFVPSATALKQTLKTSPWLGTCYVASLKLNFLICNRDNHGTYLIGLLQGSNEKITGKSWAPGP